MIACAVEGGMAESVKNEFFTRRFVLALLAAKSLMRSLNKVETKAAQR